MSTTWLSPEYIEDWRAFYEYANTEIERRLAEAFGYTGPMMDDRDIEFPVVGDVMTRVLQCAGQMPDMFETGKTINRQGERIFYVFDKVNHNVLFEGDGDLTLFHWLLSVKELILGENGYTRKDVPWDGSWKKLLMWWENYVFEGEFPLLSGEIV